MALVAGGRREPDRRRQVAKVGSNVRLSAYLDDAAESILRMETSRHIQPTDYDTCWVPRLLNPDGTLAYPDLRASCSSVSIPTEAGAAVFPTRTIAS